MRMASSDRGSPLTPTETQSTNALRNCQTVVDDDGVTLTRCMQEATQGAGEPPILRCVVHDKEYRRLTKDYHDARNCAEGVYKTDSMPNKDEILGYSDHRICQEKFDLAQRYLEALQAERNIRVIHHKRFFLNSAFHANLLTAPFVLIWDSS
jgi:hypothetical protein